MGSITQFDKLVDLSPYPIKIEFFSFNYSGGFWYGTEKGHKPYEQKGFEPHISISPYIKSQTHKVTTLLHEIGHAIHYRRHCRWYTHHDKFLSEYHAERFALQFMLRYKLKGALRYEIKDLERNLYKFSDLWRNVIERLMSEKIWQRCLDYLQ